MNRKIWHFLTLFLIFSNISVAEEKIALLPHQARPIEYLLQHPEVKGLLINHYMGTGKTFLAIGFAEHFQEMPVVVLAPRFIEGHWLAQMKQFGVKNTQRFEFVSYHDAPEKLKNRDLSKTILILDEAHNLVRLLGSSSQEQNKKYCDLYLRLQKSNRILALTGTPIYSNEYDVAPLLNLVSGKDLFPFNEEEFRLKYTEVIPMPSFWRGYFTESMIIRSAAPTVWGLSAAGLFGPLVIAPVFALGMIAFPVINALVLPVEKFHLRRLDGSKLRIVTSKYVSYYEIPDLDKSEFPNQTRHVEEVDYNKEQFQFFLDFAEMSLDDEHLLLLLKEETPNIDPTYLKLNSTGLQKHLRNSPGAGRDIGNLGISPPKFEKIFKTMMLGGLQKTVIYSNYYENGILSFARYLDRMGLKDKYVILKPDATPEEQTKIVADYNLGKFPVLFLHPEITEGVSLKGTRQFHVMEPVLNSTVLEQVIARAVRYQSHSALPEKERHVDVYLWKAMIGGFNLKNFELKKNDWLKRYRELSDWSDFGRGLIQVDKNYYFKMYSPDEYSYLKLNDLNQNIRVLREVLQEHSIESPVLDGEQVERKSKPLPPPTTNFTLGYFFKPNIQWLGNDKLEKMPEMKSDIAFRIGIEVPLYRYLNAGAHVGYAGYSFPNQTDGSLTHLSSGLDLKAQLPIELGRQRLAPYLTGSLGISALIDTSTLQDYSRQINGSSVLKSNSFGFGPSGQLMAGFEYYPISWVGIFIEGGMQALIGLHRVNQTTSAVKSAEDTWSFNAYLLNAWQLQFGLKLGF
ncbi:MAG: helicase-related protein [Myxococcaceae bacterium]